MKLETVNTTLGIPEFGLDLVTKVIPPTVGILVVCLPFRDKIWDQLTLYKDLGTAISGAAVLVFLACLYALGTILNLLSGIGLYLVVVILVKTVPRYAELVTIKDPIAPTRPTGKPVERSSVGYWRVWSFMRTIFSWAKRAYEWVNDDAKVHVRGSVAIRLMSPNARLVLPKMGAEASLCANLAVMFGVVCAGGYFQLLQELGAGTIWTSGILSVVCLIEAILISLRNFDTEIAFLEYAQADLNDLKKRMAGVAGGRDT